MAQRALILALMALVCLTPVACKAANEAPARVYAVDVYNPARDASADLAATVALAQAEHRRILLDVGGEWCVWCGILDTYISDTPDFRQKLVRDFIVMKVNFSDDNKNEAFLSAYPPAEGYPFLIILDSDGTLLGKQGTGELESGRGYDDAKMLAFLKQWST